MHLSMLEGFYLLYAEELDLLNNSIYLNNKVNSDWGHVMHISSPLL